MGCGDGTCWGHGFTWLKDSVNEASNGAEKEVALRSLKDKLRSSDVKALIEVRVQSENSLPPPQGGR